MGESTIEEVGAAQVERAWLAAGKAGDVKRMRELHGRHPQWLDLDRVRHHPNTGGTLPKRAAISTTETSCCAL